MTYSSLEQISQIIKEYNPFESNFVVKAHHVWDEDFIDAVTLNSEASETILDAVAKINSGRLSGKTVGFALLAPKGTGKTHILSRIRHHLKQKGSGFFIYMCEYGDLSQIRRQFLQSLASSLKRKGGQGVTQCQELATALLNQAMGRNYIAESLIEQFPKALAKRPDFIHQLTLKVHQTFPDIDNTYVIKAILWTLSQAHAPFAINWLAGRDLSDAQAKIMDLPNSSKEDKDTDAFITARQILELIGYYTTPVICFDQLDGTEIADEENTMLGGFTRAQVAATLGMDIYNNLKRGALVFCTYEKTWKEELQSIAGADAIRDRIAHQKIELKPLKADDVILLVSNWLETFYSQHNLIPPHILYPFEEKQLRDLGKDGSTVREVLQWCAQNFSPVVVDPIKQFEKIYLQTEANLEDFSDDNEKIANAIAFSLNSLKKQTVEKVKIQRVEKPVPHKSRHKGYINFKIVGKEEGKPVKIGVCVLQNSNGNTVGSAIRYLTQYGTFDLTRGCLVRTKDLGKNWKVAHQYKQVLLEDLGGEWVSFKDEEIKPLLTLHQMYRELNREIFNDQDFYRFVEEKHPFSKNTLIREILSDPSGQAPEGTVDEDVEFENLLDSQLPETNEESVSELLGDCIVVG